MADDKAKQESKNERKAHFSFYDAATLKPLFPDDGTEVEYQTVDGCCLGHEKLKRKGNSYPATLPAPPVTTPDPVKTKESFCDTPPDIDPASLLVIRRKGPVTANCKPWLLADLMIGLGNTTTEQQAEGEATNPEGNASGNDPCCTIALPLLSLDESYTVTFHAYDNCYKDYLVNADALIDEVELRATAVETPGQPGRAAATHQQRTFSTRTVNGYAELAGLAPRQHYRIEVIGPREYSCVKPPKSLIHNCSAQNVDLEACFQPVSEFPARSVIFLQDGSNVRAGNLSFAASGITPSPTTDAHGIWNIPIGTSGPIDFQAQGKIFSPRSIRIGKDSPLAFIVGVAEVGVGIFGGSSKRRWRFLDEQGEPFARREVHLLQPSGLQETVRTDDAGCFDAHEGSIASAPDDDLGYEVAAFPLLTTKGE